MRKEGLDLSRYLVTGCAGFIGSAISDSLLRAGHSVVGIDSLTDYYDVDLKKQNVSELSDYERFEFQAQDLLNADFDKILPGISGIYHQAGQPGVRKSWGSDFSGYVDNNIIATQRILEAARSMTEPPKIVYASSSSVYGNAETYPTNESITPQPRSPYGVTKLAAEHLCSLYADNFGIDTVSLRYFTVYGPKQRPDMAFSRLVSAAFQGPTFEVYGDGTQVRDFTYITDVVDANVKAMTSGTKAGSIYNIAGGSNVSLRQAISTIEMLADCRLSIKWSDVVQGDVRRTSGDTALAYQQLGWSPRVDLKEGLRRHLAWAEASAACRDT
ncbi:NAD-dependent epimerase/dehydratase family protein [Gordonia sp. Z-3]|uniref:NAD-dependent epimerase/dehydratase family protein n=1 Tax=Gordonia sp. Z-3 TaxID=3115408 RepID=UPI002E2C066B|nr:NAD-dependent epimerase/dehydratase family protein [Gordonia sp. Z-3]MED5803090.1 NAD-dependent epimerase/dehydratase family protein [Gordonia sp. Z-3]